MLRKSAVIIVGLFAYAHVAYAYICPSARDFLSCPSGSTDGYLYLETGAVHCRPDGSPKVAPETGYNASEKCYSGIAGYSEQSGSQASTYLDRQPTESACIALACTVAVPSGLSAQGGTGKANISWNSTGAANYVLRRGTASTGPFTTIVTQSGTSYANTGLTNGTTYYYVVAGKLSSGATSANSAAKAARPIAKPVLNSATATVGQIALSWSAATGAAAYTVKRGTSSGSYPTTVVSGITATSYTNTGLTGGTAYYYVVIGTNTTGPSASDPSNELFATPTGAVPAVPTGLAAVQGDGRVDLSWNASSGATSYALKRSTANGGPYAAIATGITGTSYANTGLANGTTYYYVVTATNASGTSGNSSQVSATPMAAPTGLAAIGGSAKADLSWNASAGAMSYTVRRSTSSGGPYSTIVSGITGTAYANTGLTNNTTYYYVVIGVNATGSTGNSNEAFAKPIAAPTGLTATPADSQITLSWTAVAGATGYAIRRSTASGGPYADIQTGVTGTSYANTGLANGTTYYYVVAATNNGGVSDNSAQASATPSPVPAAPTDLAAVPGDAQITLSWTASANATGYKLKRSLTPNGATTTISVGNVTSYANTGLVNGTAYYYVVVATNASGTSPESLQVSATPQVPSSIVLALGSTPSRCSQKTAPSSSGVVEVRGSLAVSGGFPPYTVVWTPTPYWKSPASAPLPFLVIFRYSGPVEDFATAPPYPAITATVTDSIGGTANVSRNLVPCPDANACYLP